MNIPETAEAERIPGEALIPSVFSLLPEYA